MSSLRVRIFSSLNMEGVPFSFMYFVFCVFFNSLENEGIRRDRKSSSGENCPSVLAQSITIQKLNENRSKLNVFFNEDRGIVSFRRFRFRRRNED